MTWRNASLTSRMRPVSTSVTVRMAGEISNAARSRSLAPRSLMGGESTPLAPLGTSLCIRSPRLRLRLARPFTEDLLQILAGNRLPHPGEPPAVLHLASAAEKGGEGETRERAAHADALHARRGQLGEGQRGIAVAHHHVDRLAHG